MCGTMGHLQKQQRPLFITKSQIQVDVYGSLVLIPDFVCDMTINYLHFVVQSFSTLLIKSQVFTIQAEDQNFELEWNMTT